MSQLFYDTKNNNNNKSKTFNMAEPLTEQRIFEMFSAIQELTRQNERLTTELGAAQETLDLFEKYRSMTQEYMKMCICSSRDYLNGQWRMCEHEYQQLAQRNKAEAPSTSGGLTIEVKSSGTKSKIRAFLDSLSSQESPSGGRSLVYKSTKSRVQKRLFQDTNQNNNSSGLSVLRTSPKTAKLETCDPSLTWKKLYQISPFNSNLFEESDDEFLQQSSTPPPLMTGGLSIYDGGFEIPKPDSILSAVLEGGCPSYQNSFTKQKHNSHLSVPTLSITKSDENNNQKRSHLTFDERNSIIDRLRRHESGAKIAREYGITKQAVSAIKRRANIAGNDVSLIVKAAYPTQALSITTTSPSPVSSFQRTSPKIIRKFPKSINALCLPVNPVQMFKQQMRTKQNCDSNDAGNRSDLLLSKLLKGENIEQYNTREQPSSDKHLTQALTIEVNTEELDQHSFNSLEVQESSSSMEQEESSFIETQDKEEHHATDDNQECYSDDELVDSPLQIVENEEEEEAEGGVDSPSPPSSCESLEHQAPSPNDLSNDSHTNSHQSV